MVDRAFLLIDDVEAAFRPLTRIGRAILGACSRDVRETVLCYARRRGWTVVSYDAYATWASGILRKYEHPWLVADPLFPSCGLGARVQIVRPTRISDGLTVTLDGGWTAPDDPSAGVGLMDDAAGTGSTLRYLARMVGGIGATVSHIVLCASTTSAHRVVQTAAPIAQWLEFLRGDWRMVHLRDLCPHLPFTGRRIHRYGPIGDAAAVDVRAAATELHGGICSALYLDRDIRCAVLSARRHVVSQLSDLVGRSATIRDVGLLGPDVPALCRPDQVPVADGATLASLLPS